MSRRGLIFFILLALLNGAALTPVLSRLPWAGQHSVIVGMMCVAFVLLQLIGFIGGRGFLPRLKKRYNAAALVYVISWLSYLSFGIMSLLAIFGFGVDIISIVWTLIAPPQNAAEFDNIIVLILLTLTFGTVAVGIWRVSAGPVVRRVEIPLPLLPPSFDGFTIAQISDLHVGSTIKRAYVQRVVDTVNALQPTLIALTGDFVDGSIEDLGSDIAPIAELRAEHGMYFITGNHEYYSNAAAWIDEFRRLGARILINSHEVITQGDGQIILAGVTDYSTAGTGTTQASDPAKSLQGAPTGLTKILLAHQPASYRNAQSAGFDLQLSGHTHGGQYFPFTFLIRFFQRYYKGLNRFENMWIYVNSGTGYWGPPLRAGAPPEITLITLRPENAATAPAV